MRIIAGQYRAIALEALGKGDMGAHLRPTTDRVRENLFNILNGGKYGDPLDGARVLDLFAGTGALGLEALSRGADHVTFVENGRVAQKLISGNIARLNADDACTLLRSDAAKLPMNTADPFDLIFLDPPYNQALGEKALKCAIAGNWIASGALIVWEEEAAITPPEACELLNQKTYGRATISFLEYA